MPLYQVEGTGAARQLTTIEPVAFRDARWAERWHLQPLLRDFPKAIDPDLVIVAEEFSDWPDSSRRIDLLGLDSAGNLVVVEIKSVEEGSHMELQALRYAAMVSAMTFADVVQAYGLYLARQSRPTENAEEELRQHLGPLGSAETPSITNKPRIVLVAPGFSTEITTAVLWLTEQWGLDIRCVRVRLYQLGSSEYLDTEQELPLKSAEEYKVRLRHKADQEERVRAGRRRPRSLDEIKARASENGIGEPFLALCSAADRWGLQSGFWPWGVARFRLVKGASAGANESVLAASPTPHATGTVHLWVSPARFQTESDGAIGAQTVIDALGTRDAGGMLGKIDDSGWATLNVSPEEMNQFIERLDPVVSNRKARSGSEDSDPTGG